MKRWERWGFSVAALTVTLTGVAYLWMKYAVASDDPFAVVNHPWQTAALDWHLLASPVLILLFGIIFNSHILKKVGSSLVTNRRSGYTTLVLLAVMTSTGYLLQVSASEQWTSMFVIAHVASGVLFAVVYGAHLLISVRLRRPSRAAAPVPSPAHSAYAASPGSALERS